MTERTSAIPLEPVMGEAGIIPLDDAYLRAARAAADGRGPRSSSTRSSAASGARARSSPSSVPACAPTSDSGQASGGRPAAGSRSAGAFLRRSARAGQHGSTFGGNPLACALGLAFLDEIDASGLLERVARVGDWFRARLSALARRNPAVVAIRGRGLMWGLELDRKAAPVARRLLDEGFVVGTARQTVLRLLPPYVVPRSALAQFIRVLDAVLKEPISA